MTGLHLAHYRIDAELGRGGMGIVYRAHDTKLDRTVALKVLPPHALSSEDDRARFQREARAAARLHHAHIASIFEIGEAVPEGAPHGTEPRPFIAMEFVDGESLAARIAKGPLRLDEATRIAGQIAAALGAAHEAGIVHRDVKSGNVMLTTKGEAKVLDFGLAKTAASTQLTRQGSTLGTVAYMSPEQARGEEVDGRTDLWALGVVLYEMVAGRLPFPADYEQAALYGILNEDPEPLTAVRTGVPMELEAVVSKLLRKEPRLRYQTARDVTADLESVALGSRTGLSARSVAAMPAPAAVRAVPERRARLYAAWAGVAGLLVGAIAVAAVLGRGGAAETVPVTTKRLTHTVPIRGSAVTLDMSPDGRKVAYVSDIVRVLDLESGRITELPEAGAVIAVDFSADSGSLLLTRSSDIVRIPVSGGTPLVVVTSREGGPRAVWGPGDLIFYEEDNRIFRASLAGGAPAPATSLDEESGEFDNDWPEVLPGGRVLMATVEVLDRPARIGFWDIESGERLATLDTPGYGAQWVPTGHLLMELDGAAVAVPFDAGSLRQTGPVIPVLSLAVRDGLSFAADGTFVYSRADIGLRVISSYVAPFVLRLGTNIAVYSDLEPDYYQHARVHPNGSRAVLTVAVQGDAQVRQDIWLLDFETGSRRRLTETGDASFPVWTAGGDSLLYFRFPPGGQNVFVVTRAADGSGRERIVHRGDAPGKWDLDVSTDGRLIAYVQGVPSLEDRITSLAVYRLRDNEQVAEFSGRFDNPRRPAFSPDGRYLAFEEQGAIRVISLANPEAVPLTVWARGMVQPRWASDGTALLATAEDGNPHTVDVTLDPVFAVRSPSRQAANWPVAGSNLFDVFPDGQTVLLPGLPDDAGGPSAQAGEETGSFDLHFVINWFDELRRQSR
jgi:Tol biopolymer transport system component